MSILGKLATQLITPSNGGMKTALFTTRAPGEAYESSHNLQSIFESLTRHFLFFYFDQSLRELFLCYCIKSFDHIN
jgi:hypothetical protein